MSERKYRNPVDVAFARGDQPRHQVHEDKRRQRRVKHSHRQHVEWDGD
jgi:hypothetical protein